MIEYICIEDEEELKDNISDSGRKVVHMKREVNGYFIHVICCQFSDVKELENNWEELVTNVADIVQKKLKELIEIFNIYIIFFQVGIDEFVVDKIEQNKYSSRKLVINQKMPEDRDELKNIISRKLFELDIEKDNSKPNFVIKEMDFLNDSESENREFAMEQYIEKRAEGEYQ